MISKYETKYVELIKQILVEGEYREARNATTIALFGTSLEFRIDVAFPLLLGRKLYYKGVLGELEAMLKGPKSIADFEAVGCRYWKQWAKPDGTIDVDYGNVWLDFNGVNQLKNTINQLKDNPFSRRHIITGWKPDNLETTDLPCCHIMYQWYVNNNGELDLQWYQRSVDVMIGLPADAILAAAWLIAMSRATKLKPGKIKMIFGDTHIYHEHLENTHVYINNCNTIVKDFWPEMLPIWVYNRPDEPTWDNLFKADDLTISYYKPCEPIKFRAIP